MDPSPALGAARTRITPQNAETRPTTDDHTRSHNGRVSEDTAKKEGSKDNVTQDEVLSSHDEEVFVDIYCQLTKKLVTNVDGLSKIPMTMQ